MLGGVRGAPWRGCMAKVSVIIAAYNAAGTVADCLDSLIQQSLSDWEAILVDDASTDSTAVVVERYLTDPRILYVRLRHNVGSGAARNIALAKATSDLVAVLDADDIALPGRLERQYEEFLADPDLVVLGAQVAEFGLWGGPQVRNRPTDGAELERLLRAGKMPIAHNASMYRRSAVLAVGGYDEACRRAQDFALLRRLGGRGVRAIDAVLLLYRTERPVSFRYVVMSGRYGRLARRRTSGPRGAKARYRGLPWSLTTDARSAVTWLRRRLVEKAERPTP